MGFCFWGIIFSHLLANANVNIEQTAFSSPLQRTQQGGSCHVFAAAGLFESACFRRAGVSIKVNESYLFASHLRERIVNEGYDVDAPVTSGAYTSKDGGTSYRALQRILGGDSYTDRELLVPFEKLWQSGLGPIRTIAKTARDTLQLQEYRMDYAEREHLRKRLSLGASSQLLNALGNHLAGYYPKLQVRDPDLQRCLRIGLVVRERDATDSAAMGIAINLLNAGIPFICSGEYNYGSRVGMHASIITGYALLSGPNGARSYYFRFRDSNNLPPHTFKCRSIIAVDRPEVLAGIF